MHLQLSLRAVSSRGERSHDYPVQLCLVRRRLWNAGQSANGAAVVGVVSATSVPGVRSSWDIAGLPGVEARLNDAVQQQQTLDAMNASYLPRCGCPHAASCSASAAWLSPCIMQAVSLLGSAQCSSSCMTDHCSACDIVTSASQAICITSALPAPCGMK